MDDTAHTTLLLTIANYLRGTAYRSDLEAAFAAASPPSGGGNDEEDPNVLPLHEIPEGYQLRSCEPVGTHGGWLATIGCHGERFIRYGVITATPRAALREAIKRAMRRDPDHMATLFR